MSVLACFRLLLQGRRDAAFEIRRRMIIEGSVVQR
jgi:hypothetical protein